MFVKNNLKEYLGAAFIPSLIIVIIQYISFSNCMDIAVKSIAMEWEAFSCLLIFQPGILPTLFFIPGLDNFSPIVGIFIICCLNLIFLTGLITPLIILCKKLIKILNITKLNGKL